MKTDEQIKPIIIFGGKNGTGKTTLLEAFKICLFGNSFKGRKIPNGDYIKHVRSRLHRASDGSKAASASITMEFDYARAGFVDSYIVKRSWTSTDVDIAESLDIQKNNQPLTEVNKEQWQDFLMEIIPPGLSTLFFFDGEKIQNLARGQGENQHIMESMNSLLGIDLIERLKTDIKLYSAKESLTEKSAFEKKLVECENKIRLLKDEQEKILQEEAFARTKISRVKTEIENQELRISNEGGGFASQREQLKLKASLLEQEIELTKEKIRSLSTGLLPFTFVPELCQALKNRLRNEETEQQRQATLNYLSSAANDLSRDIGHNLSFNFIKLSEEEKQLVANEAIRALRNQIAKRNGAGKKNIHEVSSLERQELLSWIDVVLNQVPIEIKKLSGRLTELKVEYEKIKGYIYNAPPDDVLRPLFIKLRQLHEELATRQQQLSAIEKEIISIKFQLTLAEREKGVLLNEKSSFDKANRQLELIAKTQDVLEEYQQRLRNEKVNDFRENFLESFNLLFGKENLISDVSVSSINFNITLLGAHGNSISKAELSAGERQIYAMAMIWALAKTSGRPLPFIIDTPLGRLDTEHRNNLMENFFTSASHQIIVFSTNTEIDEHYFDQIQPYVARSYNLEYDSTKGETVVREGYFWKNMEATD
jgi:DNA sulfur modification protein DndD